MPSKSETGTVRAARIQLRRRLKAIANERDQLRSLRDDIDCLISSCDDGVDGLETAIEALSRYA
jgi:hypothetical protein